MSLRLTLNTMREKATERMPPESLEIMHRATEELRASGILEGVAKVGDPLPSFALQNTAGEWVRSEEVLSEGPLIVNFFRGRW